MQSPNNRSFSSESERRSLSLNDFVGKSPKMTGLDLDFAEHSITIDKHAVMLSKCIDHILSEIGGLAFFHLQ
jgi:hypothetical protein